MIVNEIQLKNGKVAYGKFILSIPLRKTGE